MYKRTLGNIKMENKNVFEIGWTVGACCLHFMLGVREVSQCLWKTEFKKIYRVPVVAQHCSCGSTTLFLW